jgi:hypothetical protein
LTAQVVDREAGKGAAADAGKADTRTARTAQRQERSLLAERFIDILLLEKARHRTGSLQLYPATIRKVPDDVERARPLSLVFRSRSSLIAEELL